MHLRTKLIFGYLIVALGSFVATYFDHSTTKNIDHSFQSVAQETVPTIEALAEIKFAALRVVSSTSEYGFLNAERSVALRSGSPIVDADAEGQELLELEFVANAQLNRAVAHYTTLVTAHGHNDTALVSSLDTLSQTLLASSKTIIDAKQEGISGTEIIELKEAFEVEERQLIALLDEALAAEKQVLAERTEVVHHEIIQGNRQVLLASLITFGIAVVIGLYLSQVISRPIRRLQQAIERIGTRQNHIDIEVAHDDELGSLVRAFNQMAQETRKNFTKLQEEIEQQKRLNEKLEHAQNQLLQSEKMASVGQLAAGVAHEINNPVGYINSNLKSLRIYSEQLITLIAAYGEIDPNHMEPDQSRRIMKLKEEMDLEFIEQDLCELIDESISGTQRIKDIVVDLKDFSHTSSKHWETADLLKGLESTINVVWNELKYKAEIVKEYGELPLVECIPSQLNQIFMNLLVNAAHAIEKRGTITIKTFSKAGEAFIEISDTGKGISEAALKRVFEPFFTTKAIGKGTGLGLSVSYGIIKNHNGRIEVQSQVGVGTKFTVVCPIKRQYAA